MSNAIQTEVSNFPRTLKQWREQRRFLCLRAAGQHPVTGEPVYRDGTRERSPYFRAGDLILLPGQAYMIEVRSFAELLDAGRAPGVDRWDFARAAELLAAEVR